MSQNLYRLTSRTRMVDDRGFPTAEFLRFAEALYARGGGTEGFSNQELFQEIAAPVPYDELVERIGALEAQIRGLQQALSQAMQISFEQGAQQERVAQVGTQDTLRVKGMTELNTAEGRTLIGGPSDDGSTQLQVNGDIAADNLYVGGDLTVDGAFSIGVLNVTNLDASGAVTAGTTLDVATDATVGGQLGVTGTVSAAAYDTAGNYLVAGLQVVGARVTGWEAPTGSPTRTTFAVYPGQTISATYTPAEIQLLDDTVATLSEKLAALVNDCRAHGLIGA